jgi:hypothetical protein
MVDLHSVRPHDFFIWEYGLPAELHVLIFLPEKKAISMFYIIQAILIYVFVVDIIFFLVDGYLLLFWLMGIFHQAGICIDHYTESLRLTILAVTDRSSKQFILLSFSLPSARDGSRADSDGTLAAERMCCQLI